MKTTWKQIEEDLKNHPIHPECADVAIGFFKSIIHSKLTALLQEIREGLKDRIEKRIWNPHAEAGDTPKPELPKEKLSNCCKARMILGQYVHFGWRGKGKEGVPYCGKCFKPEPHEPKEKRKIRIFNIKLPNGDIVNLHDGYEGQVSFKFHLSPNPLEPEKESDWEERLAEEQNKDDFSWKEFIRQTLLEATEDIKKKAVEELEELKVNPKYGETSRAVTDYAIGRNDALSEAITAIKKIK